LPTKEKIITTPIWLKLLAINIVAKSFFGRCNNFVITLAFKESSVASVFKSLEVREKRATSAADTIADENKKNTIPTLPKSSFVSIVAKKERLGSGSKGIRIS
jgi:hypothetical protein